MKEMSNVMAICAKIAILALYVRTREKIAFGFRAVLLLESLLPHGKKW
jgi:hypothetical protein